MLISMNADQTIQINAILCQTDLFFDDKKNPLKSRENQANSSEKWQKKGKKKIMLKILFICHGTL